MNAYQLSKRFMVMFTRDAAVNNVQFFRTGLKVEPVVHVFWSRRPLSGEPSWQAWCYVVAERGHKPYDITEAHVRMAIEGRPEHEIATTMSAEEFLKAIEGRPTSWHHDKEGLVGKRSWEPRNEKRNREDKEAESYWFAHQCYKESLIK